MGIYSPSNLWKARLNKPFLRIASRTFNPLVAGSNPARPTTNAQEAHEFRFVGFFVFAVDGPLTKSRHHSLDRQEHRPTIRRVLDEFCTLQIEALRTFVLGMNEHRAHSNTP